MCRIVVMLGCTQYTQSTLILHFSSCSTHKNTPLHKEIPFFYFSLDTNGCILHHFLFLTLAVSLSRTHSHKHKLLQAMYRSGLPCCLSNQCMGSFQLQWSEHFIPFHFSPLPNIETLKYMPSHTHSHTMFVQCSLHMHSTEETLISPVYPKDWCASLGKMRFCAITR